ncbi:UDP-galactose transporter [Phanerochaete sordida]|uniref:UDP-galactose transporter n=1 Tax=Phanerochaete sordida TaxID=48140 RepID=A0A9P3G9W2_9APHY|nr:UDP-galactose transporter [Phanerochaete sordida]
MSQQSEQYKDPSLHFEVEVHEEDAYEKEELGLPPADATPAVPSICGLPLKYVSLVTLAVQNAALTLIMHWSRVSAAPSHTYSAAAAVLMVELLKGSISLVVAFSRLDSYAPQYQPLGQQSSTSLLNPWVWLSRFRRLGKEVFRSDCWKLSIPAILYVIQNNLQFVAVSNLEAATFQVSYQMKILTTAAFSVVMLRKKLSPVKWMALLFLAIGVGIVQIQSGSGHKSSDEVQRDMNAFKGFMAVVAACFTSGLAGVYFEMVLKNSPGDLWVRNVQLSLFSLLPALVPIVFSGNSNPSPTSPSGWFTTSLFENFGVWAWATVLTQVLGGLLTALVIKYADNILKGFATSLSIVISFLVSVALFHFEITVSFILGATVVLVATWMYNQPDSSSSTSGSEGTRESRAWSWHWRRPAFCSRNASALELTGGTLSRRASTSSLSSLASATARPPYHHAPSKSFPPSPTDRHSPAFGGADGAAPAARQQGQFFAAPLRATKVFAHRHIGLFRSASFGARPEPDAAAEYPLLAQSASYPASRPGSALGAYPASRPPSSLASSARPSLDRAS